MKNIYSDNAILTPSQMETIAKEYYKQNNNQSDFFVMQKLHHNMQLLEHISNTANNSPSAQKYAIKTFALIKNSCYNKTQPCTLPQSTFLAKRICVQNSLEIILHICNSFKHLLNDCDFKTIKTCIDTISSLT